MLLSSLPPFLLQDRTLLPDLVDCPKECQSSAHTIFSLLDTDADGLLTAADATMLTPTTFTLLTQELDDLVDELVEMGQEQWYQIIQVRDRLTFEMQMVTFSDLHTTERVYSSSNDPTLAV